MSTTIEIEFPMTLRVPGAATTDHGNLTGLQDDDHPQYHTDARGDARYSPLGHTHETLPALDVTTFRLALGGGQFLRLVPVQDAVTGLWTIEPRVES